MLSEHALVSKFLNRSGVVGKSFVDVVGVGGESSPLLLHGVAVSLCQELLSGRNVLLHHLAEKDVVDFDVMR